MTMRPLESSYVVYGRTYQEAIEVIRRRGLWNCAPNPAPWLGIWFSDERDLTLFALQFQGVLDFIDALAVVPPWQVEEVEGFLTDREWGERIDRHDLLAVEFWDAEDQRIFDKEFGLEMTIDGAAPSTDSHC